MLERVKLPQQIIIRGSVTQSPKGQFPANFVFLDCCWPSLSCVFSAPSQGWRHDLGWWPCSGHVLHDSTSLIEVIYKQDLTRFLPPLCPSLLRSELRIRTGLLQILYTDQPNDEAYLLIYHHGRILYAQIVRPMPLSETRLQADWI
jgi:hypothetical protein